MVRNKWDMEKILLISIVTVFMGQIYISPIPGAFRLSLAVLTLSILLINFPQVPVMPVCLSIALITPFFRTFVDLITYPEVTFNETFSYYYPVALYYIFYGLLFNFLEIRKKLDNSAYLMVSLWFCDSVPNFAEALYRRLFAGFDFKTVAINIIVIGLVRSLLTYFLYCATKYYKERYDRKQKESKYREMVLFISSLKSELFFLKKSMTDIEDAMQMSYDLYRELSDKAQKERLLTLSKNVHEIKKDYYRVVNGMEKVLSKESSNMSMSLSEIFEIVGENSEKIISARNKSIELDFRSQDNFQTTDFYPLISVLNNLIINSIEAIGKSGRIIVDQKSAEDFYLFTVEDDGSGIDADETDMIFEPGFSTRYDPATGRMSTGLGLSHVKQIVEVYFRGNIDLESSKLEKRTSFKAKIPKNNIELKG